MRAVVKAWSCILCQGCLRLSHGQAAWCTCGRYCRIWDDADEALQPEWEIDPKDLQILEKVGAFYTLPDLWRMHATLPDPCLDHL